MGQQHSASGRRTMVHDHSSKYTIHVVCVLSHWFNDYLIATLLESRTSSPPPLVAVPNTTHSRRASVLLLTRYYALCDTNERDSQPFNGHIKTAEQQTIVQQLNRVICTLAVDGGTGRGPSPPMPPILSVPNVTAHPSTASVPT